MIPVKQAVKIAGEFLVDLMESPPKNLLVEEVELLDNEKTWRITLGFTAPPDVPFLNPTRTYKEFFVDSETGAVKSMKIRLFNVQ